MVLVAIFVDFSSFFPILARNERKPETASNQHRPTAGEMLARDHKRPTTPSAPLEGGSPSQPGQLRPDSVQPCWRTGGRLLCIPGRSSFCPPIFVLDYLGLSLQKASVLLGRVHFGVKMSIFVDFWSIFPHISAKYVGFFVDFWSLFSTFSCFGGDVVLI